MTTGRNVTDLDYVSVMVLQAINRSPLYLQSNLARSNAHAIGKLASLGLITTHLGKGNYGNQWRITRKGLKELGV